VRRRLEDPQFVSRVRARRSAILDEVNAFIVSSARAAAETIDELRLGAESESVRLNAALAVIRTSRSIVEVDALGERCQVSSRSWSSWKRNSGRKTLDEHARD
jgi:hypothetical protein